jgi:hypothetical protein
MHWLKIIYYSMLVVALVGSFFGYNNKKYWLFIPLIAISLGIEILRDLLPDDSLVEPSILLFQVIAEYSILSLIISHFIQSPTKKKIIIGSIVVVIPLFILLQIFLISRYPTYTYLNNTIEAPFICLWTILYLFEVARHEYEFEISTNPMFWISLGNLLFYSGSFFSYAFGSYLMSADAKGGDTIFLIAQILNILLYILYFIGFLCLRLRKSYYSQL